MAGLIAYRGELNKGELNKGELNTTEQNKGK